MRLELTSLLVVKLIYIIYAILYSDHSVLRLNVVKIQLEESV